LWGVVAVAVAAAAAVRYDLRWLRPRRRRPRSAASVAGATTATYRPPRTNRPKSRRRTRVTWKAASVAVAVATTKTTATEQTLRRPSRPKPPPNRRTSGGRIDAPAAALTTMVGIITPSSDAEIYRSGRGTPGYRPPPQNLNLFVKLPIREADVFRATLYLYTIILY